MSAIVQPHPRTTPLKLALGALFLVPVAVALLVLVAAGLLLSWPLIPVLVYVREKGFGSLMQLASALHELREEIDDEIASTWLVKNHVAGPEKQVSEAGEHKAIVS